MPEVAWLLGANIGGILEWGKGVDMRHAPTAKAMGWGRRVASHG